MFEAEDTEQLSSDVEVAAPSESHTEAQSPEAQSTEGKQAAETQQKEVPFHEHPRWKQVMDERNAERERAKTLERQVADMQKQFQQSRVPESQDKVYERLNGIDPEFANYVKEIKEQASIAKQLQDELASMRTEQFTQTARSEFAALNAKNAISPELSKIYEQQLEAAYARGEFKDINGLKEVYKNVHDTFTKILGERDRVAIEKYTTSKKSDASKPSPQPRGKSTAGSNKMEFSKDPAESRQQLISSIVKQTRAGSDL